MTGMGPLPSSFRRSNWICAGPLVAALSVKDIRQRSVALLRQVSRRLGRAPCLGRPNTQRSCERCEWPWRRQTAPIAKRYLERLGVYSGRPGAADAPDDAEERRRGWWIEGCASPRCSSKHESRCLGAYLSPFLIQDFLVERAWSNPRDSPNGETGLDQPHSSSTGCIFLPHAK